jgi:hypothetical protein
MTQSYLMVDTAVILGSLCSAGRNHYALIALRRRPGRRDHAGGGGTVHAMIVTTRPQELTAVLTDLDGVGCWRYWRY